MSDTLFKLPPRRKVKGWLRCPCCGKGFNQHRTGRTRKYCSPRCRVMGHRITKSGHWHHWKTATGS